jgi:tRNA(adenine34) deaminase
LRRLNHHNKGYSTVIDIRDHDLRYLERTLTIARQALQIGEAPIGCVLVADEQEVIATAHNRNFSEGSRVHHAEMQAIIMAQKVLNLKEPYLTLYSSLELCPMCFSMAVIARVNRVVWACNDPHGGVADTMTQAMWPYHTLPLKVVEPFPDLRDEVRQVMMKFWSAQDRDDILELWLET